MIIQNILAKPHSPEIIADSKLEFIRRFFFFCQPLNDPRVLIFNDFVSVGATLSKIIPNADMLYTHGFRNKIIPGKNPRYLKNVNFGLQRKEFDDIKENYDVVICFGWDSALICYLANVDYIPYINDYFIGPRDRIFKDLSGLRRWFRNKLYDDILVSANTIVSGSRYYTERLRDYRNDHIEEIVNPIDFERYNTKPVSKPHIKKEKFTFLTPARIEPWKGTDILMSAIKETSTDFEVHLVDWSGIDKSYYTKIVENLPKKVKLIPKINPQEIVNYYKSVDAVMGDIEEAYAPAIEKEAIACGVPVFHSDELGYTDNDPFYKGARDPKSIAQYIDRMVRDDKFRQELQRKQYEWLHQIINYQNQLQQWNRVFNMIKSKKRRKAKTIYHKIYEMTFLLRKLKNRDIH